MTRLEAFTGKGYSIDRSQVPLKSAALTPPLFLTSLSESSHLPRAPAILHDLPSKIQARQRAPWISAHSNWPTAQERTWAGSRWSRRCRASKPGFSFQDNARPRLATISEDDKRATATGAWRGLSDENGLRITDNGLTTLFRPLTFVRKDWKLGSCTQLPLPTSTRLNGHGRTDDAEDSEQAFTTSPHPNVSPRSVQRILGCTLNPPTFLAYRRRRTSSATIFSEQRLATRMPRNGAGKQRRPPKATWGCTYGLRQRREYARLSSWKRSALRGGTRLPVREQVMGVVQLSKKRWVNIRTPVAS
ncbi:hypothetical protein C8F01DRAFT_1231927 [Mycena amicta]|nr:hypothetical protein C8F01DRAFT_1231927 [Mycena amicta]